MITIADVPLFVGYVIGSYFIGYCMSYLPYMFRRLAIAST